jgi:hypothetical protein
MGINLGNGYLIQQAMFKSTGADVHSVGQVCSVLAIYQKLGTKPGIAAELGLECKQKTEVLEHCLRMYLGGLPIRRAMKAAGLADGINF